MLIQILHHIPHFVTQLPSHFLPGDVKCASAIFFRMLRDDDSSKKRKQQKKKKNLPIFQVEKSPAQNFVVLFFYTADQRMGFTPALAKASSVVTATLPWPKATELASSSFAVAVPLRDDSESFNNMVLLQLIIYTIPFHGFFLSCQQLYNIWLDSCISLCVFTIVLWNNLFVCSGRAHRWCKSSVLYFHSHDIIQLYTFVQLDPPKKSRRSKISVSLEQSPRLPRLGQRLHANPLSETCNGIQGRQRGSFPLTHSAHLDKKVFAVSVGCWRFIGTSSETIKIGTNKINTQLQNVMKSFAAQLGFCQKSPLPPFFYQTGAEVSTSWVSP